jgi:hypothetical protein
MSDSSSHYQQLSSDEEVRKYPKPTPATTSSHVKRDATVLVLDTEHLIDREIERAIEIAMERLHGYNDLIRAVSERVNREVIGILLSTGNGIYSDLPDQVEATDKT